MDGDPYLHWDQPVYARSCHREVHLLSEIAGFSKSHPYHQFEDAVTRELDRLFQSELDPDIKEMTRLQILKTRCWCRDYWTAIGNQVPPDLKFLEEE